MNKKDVKVGSMLVYKKCSCGDVDLTVGNKYEVLAVKYPMVIFLDDKNTRRVKSVETRCFDLAND